MVTRSNTAKMLQEGLNVVYEAGAKKRQNEYTKIFKKEKSNKAYEEDVQVS